jgi:thiol-disulfide isomerase/thioredoxin
MKSESEFEFVITFKNNFSILFVNYTCLCFFKRHKGFNSSCIYLMFNFNKQLIYFAQLCVILFRQGIAFDQVVELNEETIEKTINLPETKFWFVSFYAPWCKASKSFLSILDDVAPTLNGQMSFGKVDCSVQESFCEQHGIFGYPSLKWYVNGSFHDYKGKRDHDGILSFAKKMNSPVINKLDDFKQLVDVDPMDQESNGSLFVLYHSSLLGGQEYDAALDKEIQTFMHVAQDFQATNTFVHLETNDMNEAWVGAFELSSQSSHNILFKLEKDLKPVFFQSDWSSIALHSFMSQNNEVAVPFVNEMNAGDFGYRDKYLAIAILDPIENEDASTAFLSEFRQLASSCSQHINRHYQFVWINGKEWNSFLHKYSLSAKDTPQLFVLDYPHDIYWTNPNNSSDSITEMGGFLLDILETKVLSKHLKDKHDDDDLYERLVWLTNNVWVLHIQLLFCVFGLTLILPKSIGRVHNCVEIYFLRRCVDPILEYLGLMNYENKKKKND